MDLLEIIIITLHITQIYSRNRKFLSSSDESIDNFVYFQDCTHKKETTTTAAPISPLRNAYMDTPRQQPDCPFPRMCCALTCGNECGNQQSFVSRQMQPLQAGPSQPQISPRVRKRRPKPMKLPPIGSRRDFGFTKEKIKSLISQDDDIRKILKDLVRVTMQKVDVMEMINAKNAETTTVVNISDDYE